MGQPARNLVCCFGASLIAGGTFAIPILTIVPAAIFGLYVLGQIHPKIRLHFIYNLNGFSFGL